MRMQFISGKVDFFEISVDGFGKHLRHQFYNGSLPSKRRSNDAVELVAWADDLLRRDPDVKLTLYTWYRSDNRLYKKRQAGLDCTGQTKVGDRRDLVFCRSCEAQTWILAVPEDQRPSYRIPTCEQCTRHSFPPDLNMYDGSHVREY